MKYTEHISESFKSLQQSIIQGLETIDGIEVFKNDIWFREEGGGGNSAIIQNGGVIEKGGVNFSAVFGPLPSPLLKQGLTAGQFFATGVSIVLHPHNPHVPIIHMNVRYFEMDNGMWWFGGGIDLTPHYIVDSHAEAFHSKLKDVCDKHDLRFYRAFKPWADTYFFIKHRHETRGIGGIFFDQQNTHTSGKTREELEAFVLELGASFVDIYQQQVGFGNQKEYTSQEKEFQFIRRGRYVEFNLVYDRGTKFGLETGGRIESILMSLPQTANWQYDYTPLADSREERTINILKTEQNWLNLNSYIHLNEDHSLPHPENQPL
jgi:coproporphyrinogen III oxidase